MRGSKSNLVMEHKLERLIFFSDAVFAIAITLLVIEIHPPHLESGNPSTALAQLAGIWPSIFGFVLSFLVIGRFWIGHHAALSGVPSFSPRLLLPNLTMLMAIAFMPFVTALMSQNPGNLVAFACYHLFLSLTGLINWWLVSVATSFWPRAESGEIWAMQSRSLGVVAGGLTAFGCVFISPPFSPIALASIPLWMRLIRRLGASRMGH